MKFYKLIQDTSFIGIASSENFREYNEDSGYLLMSNEVNGQFVELHSQLYRDTWMALLPQKQFSFQEVRIIEITEQEFMEILALDFVDDPDYDPYIGPDYEPPVYDEPIDNSSEITLEYAKTQKLAQLSNICRTTIENGFDLELRGEIHHFSLDTQDQLNLISLSAMAATQQLIPYHADGESCIFYTNEEINQIVETATAFKIYHTTYHNALKGYVNALETVEQVSAIEYGAPIPEEYKSDVLRVLEQ